MQIHISEIMIKAEAYYKTSMPDEDYDKMIEELKASILIFIEKVKTENNEIIPIWEAVDYFITKDNDDHFKAFSIIAGFKLEHEKQAIKENKEELQMMLKIVLTEFKKFYVPEDIDMGVVTVDEFVEAIEERNKHIRKVRLKMFFLNSWIYFPLALPFVIIKGVILIISLIKPIWKEAKKEALAGRDLFKMVEDRLNEMPAIFHVEHFHHHILIGILLWLLFFTWILH